MIDNIFNHGTVHLKGLSVLVLSRLIFNTAFVAERMCQCLKIISVLDKLMSALLYIKACVNTSQCALERKYGLHTMFVILLFCLNVFVYFFYVLKYLTKFYIQTNNNKRKQENKKKCIKLLFDFVK